MFHNNLKIDSVVDAVNQVLGNTESVEEAHKPLLPKQKEVQKKIDAETKKQHPKSIPAGSGYSYERTFKKEEVSFKDRLIENLKGKKEDNLIPEEEMSDAQMKKREKIVMAMKDKEGYFKKKYGTRWKNVMFATATKQAMAEELVTEKHDDEAEDQKLIDKSMKKHQEDPNAHKASIKNMVKKDCLKSEEVEQVDEMDSEGYRGRRDDQDYGKGKWHKATPVTGKQMSQDAMKKFKTAMKKSKSNRTVNKEEVEQVAEASVNDAEVTTDMLRGRVEGGKTNSFKNFKVKLKAPETFPRAPESEEKPSETAARKSIETKKVPNEKQLSVNSKVTQEGKDPNMDAGVGANPDDVPYESKTPKQTPMSRARELAKSSLMKVTKNLGK
jgi:hypothetical protein